MAWSLDGSNSAVFGGSRGADGVVTLTTSLADDIIILQISTETDTLPAQTVASVSGGGLTWALRKRLAWTNSSDSTPNNHEIWWAHAPAPLAGVTITATMTGTIDDGTVTAFGVNGSSHFTNPWDGNASLPGTATNLTGTDPGTQTVTGISTNAASGIMLEFICSDAQANFVPESSPLSFTGIENPQNSYNTLWEYADQAYHIFSSVIAGASITYSTTLGKNGMIVDALSNGGGGPGLSPVEAPDVMAFVGHVEIPHARRTFFIC